MVMSSVNRGGDDWYGARGCVEFVLAEGTMVSYRGYELLRRISDFFNRLLHFSAFYPDYYFILFFPSNFFSSFFLFFFLMQRCFLVLHCTAFGCSGVLS